eukprot:GEZU01005571.1.p2 GENE.GEZU01005571.1~~GEZU01005571.1.p2  ORF type:complete len:107 (+),score=30.05 GEZU01005571.1:297-617(+)
MEKPSDSPASTKEQEAMIMRHCGVLGLSALVLAFPYEVPAFMPQILMRLASYQNDRDVTIQTTVRRTLMEFWRTHRDMWSIVHKQRFTEDELSTLIDIMISPSYYV